jgi:hypothetical protein
VFTSFHRWEKEFLSGAQYCLHEGARRLRRFGRDNDAGFDISSDPSEVQR